MSYILAVNIEMETRNIIYNHSKKEKYLVINLTKQVQDLYAKDNKMLIIKIKEDLNKWRDVLPTIQPSIYPREMKVYLHTKIYINVYPALCVIANTVTTHMSFVE